MSSAASRRIRQVGIAIFAIVLLVAAGVLARPYLFHSDQSSNDQPPAPAANDDPRLTFDTPFLNVRPDVKYVGDSACADCHKPQAEHYARHPMGRSMGRSIDQIGMEPRGLEAHNPFEKYGNTYSVVVRDGKVYHREERRDASGKPVVATECEAPFAVGSGTRGKSYLIDRGGRLFMSPISWYAEKKIWDISPNYPEDMRFNRPVSVKCLYCHCNQANALDGPINTYKQPAFSGLSIGCERCHGPGELHVKLRESGEKVAKPDYSIVNPDRLEPRLRDAVCEQCHLQGEQRELTRGRGVFDFRPGMPLYDFWAIHVRIPELMASYRSVGQFEQMHLSKCYEASDGKLGCISCHDPHERPSAEKRVGFYRDRCLKCHESHGCKMNVAERKKKQPDDSCIICHMSKDGSSNIPHTAVTDHRILRRPEQSAPKKPLPLQPDKSPIVNFHEGQPGFDRSAAARDLGVALSAIMRLGPMNAIPLSGLAEPILQQATRDRPDDALAWLSLASVLEAQRRNSDALDAYNKCLKLKPNEEKALEFAAGLTARIGRSDDAIGYYKRVIEVNPYLARYHLELAGLYAERRQWTLAQESFEATLRLEPVNTEARTRLIACLLRTGQNDQAKKHFDTLMALKPKNEAELRSWYERQTR